jgi:hypothetical protein
MMVHEYDPDELLDVRYLAAISHLSERTIRGYIKKHNIPAILHQIGYRGVYKIFVRREDWRRFLFSSAFNNCRPVMHKRKKDGQ